MKKSNEGIKDRKNETNDKNSFNERNKDHINKAAVKYPLVPALRKTDNNLENEKIYTNLVPIYNQSDGNSGRRFKFRPYKVQR